MLKEAASVVLGSSKSSAYPRGYVSGSSLSEALHAERRILVRRGWVGENSGSFEHPARKSSGTCSGIALIH